MKTAAAVLLAALLAFGALTWWALEADGVAVLQTRQPDGRVRETHVWYAAHEGALWLEAATPDRGWLRDALRVPRVVLVVNGRPATFRAERVPDPAAHGRIRSLLREKYGFRDWWVGHLQDTSRSVAVRLIPESR